MLTLIVRADIRTMHAPIPRAEAAVVDGERFAFVGAEKDARDFIAGRPLRMLDAGGATVVPGFNDSHLHCVHGAMRARSVVLDGARSIVEAVSLMRAGLPRLRGGWLIAEGWNQENFAEKRLLTRDDLDEVSRDVPIVATRACGHIAAVNSRALAIASLDVPDGILREDEQGAVWAHIPPPDAQTMLDALLAEQARLFAQGITSVQSDDLGSGVPLRAIRDLGDAGRLKVRYAAQALMGNLTDMDRFFAEELHALRGERFRVSCIKLLADGSLGARTALLDRPYADAPDTRGIAMFAGEELCALVRGAASHGLPTAAHAIGDGAMRQVLAAFEQEGRGLRNAVVHAQITTARQVKRCGEMGLAILAQPIFLRADAPIVESRVGAELAATSYGWRTMRRAGARVAFGTDSPVEPFDVMPGLYCAVTRRGGPSQPAYLPDEAFTLEEALFAYTAAGAWVSGEENEKGRIAPGMLADFAVLDRALDEKEPASLLETGVRETYIGGERVYSA